MWYYAKHSFCYFLILSFVSCATLGQITRKSINFSQFCDKPLPINVSDWLEYGKQSKVTPAISAITSQISGLNRRERLYKAIDYIHNNFIYDNWYSDKAFTQTADELFKTRILGGCSNFALVTVTLFRALEIPARVVLTANVDWMLAYRENNLLISTGHVFIEAYLEDRWYLVDPTYRIIFLDYDPGSHSYPRREYFCLRGKDYWESGITDVSKLNEVMEKTARIFKEEYYITPKTKKLDIRLSSITAFFAFFNQSNQIDLPIQHDNFTTKFTKHHNR